MAVFRVSHAHKYVDYKQDTVCLVIICVLFLHVHGGNKGVHFQQEQPSFYFVIELIYTVHVYIHVILTDSYM